MATRFRTYAVTLSPDAQRYADTLLRDEAFRVWEAAGAKETMTMPVWDAF
jgi:hypothetical protein